MSNCNCYCCGRGFPDIDLLYAHLGEHPGRTVEEMERAAEAWGRLKGTDRAWMLREAEHNDEHEVTTDRPGVAVNEALAKLSNREKAVVVGARAKRQHLNQPHGPDDPEEDVVTLTPITVVETSAGDRDDWEEHDRVAVAQRKPYAEMATDFAARHLYDAREIPYLEAVGLHRNAEYARRNDAAEAEVEAEREAVLAELDRRDEVLREEGFDPSLPDTPATRAAFRAHKERLIRERAQESAAMFADQFPDEAKEQGVTKPRLTAAQKKAVSAQKKTAAAEVNRSTKRDGPTPLQEGGVLSHVNEPEARGDIVRPTIAPETLEAAKEGKTDG